MQVTFKTEGGMAFFPGLSRPSVVDSAELPAAEAARLQELIADTRFFDLPEESRALRAGAADYRQYTITVEDAGRRHTVRLADPVESPALQSLLDFLRGHAARVRSPGEPTTPPRRAGRSRKRGP